MREEEITKYHIAGDHLKTGIEEKEVDALLQRAQINIDREMNYVKLLGFLVFSVIYCIMLVYQGDITTNYSLESSVHNTILNQLSNGNGLEYGTSMFTDRGSISSYAEFYQWLGTSILNRILTQPVCGVSRIFFDS